MIELIDAQSQEAVIKVVGVGGCGGNAVDHMISQGVQGVEFVVANTDAQALKRNQATNVWVMNLRRQLPTLAANLKNQFGMISDIVTSVNLAASRGASEAVRLRAVREGIGQVKQALEIAITQTKDKHKVVDDHKTPAEGERGA